MARSLLPKQPSLVSLDDGIFYARKYIEFMEELARESEYRRLVVTSVDIFECLLVKMDEYVVPMVYSKKICHKGPAKAICAVGIYTTLAISACRLCQHHPLWKARYEFSKKIFSDTGPLFEWCDLGSDKGEATRAYWFITRCREEAAQLKWDAT